MCDRCYAIQHKPSVMHSALINEYFHIYCLKNAQLSGDLPREPVRCGLNPIPSYLLLPMSRGLRPRGLSVKSITLPSVCTLSPRERGNSRLPLNTSLLEPAPNSLTSDREAQENRQVLGEARGANTCRANGLRRIRIPVVAPCPAVLHKCNQNTRACHLRCSDSQALQVISTLCQAFSSFPGAGGTHSWPYPSPRLGLDLHVQK